MIKFPFEMLSFSKGNFFMGLPWRFNFHAFSLCRFCKWKDFISFLSFSNCNSCFFYSFEK